ncbi:hypothetical protein CRP01_35275 [Flavilitoribacter nigricans DSM 23189 = NBRC 102662]|uniref:Uncharacterized protein n=1 Tax=Flavilitoribacter nigricans (strain ATCC 23147 / DSM 23189 / NBRC 102662 / NCIMB 1420 / SS-2) TaxID=1122177 RepID=A0A2D0MZP8_FLAN2|nr:hypothetical protein CRP01_35275 [Flavilitoribacter nigricans DSM 23189 = NBRC 102662]
MSSAAGPIGKAISSGVYPLIAAGLFSSIKTQCEFFNYNVKHNSNSKQKAAFCSDFDLFARF